jgi:cytochrome c oxidase subunit IV
VKELNGLGRRVDRFALANPLRWAVIAAVSMLVVGAVVGVILQAVTDFQADWLFLALLSITLGLTAGWAARRRGRQRK